jgi:hypothetical protein
VLIACDKGEWDRLDRITAVTILGVEAVLLYPKRDIFVELNGTSDTLEDILKAIDGSSSRIRTFAGNDSVGVRYGWFCSRAPVHVFVWENRRTCEVRASCA